MNTTYPAMRTYSFVDWSGDTGFKFTLGSSSHLVTSLVSSADYGMLRQGLIKLRTQLKLPHTFEFHFTRNSKMIRTAFFAVLPHLSWDGAMLIVDKRQLSVDFARMREPTFYGFFLGQLLAQAPPCLIKSRHLLIDSREKHSSLVRGMRIAASSILLARGVRRTPKMRGEPAHRWDGLQVADMLAGALVRQVYGGTNYLRGLETHLQVYHYKAIK